MAKLNNNPALVDITSSATLNNSTRPALVGYLKADGALVGSSLTKAQVVDIILERTAAKAALAQDMADISDVFDGSITDDGSDTPVSVDDHDIYLPTTTTDSTPDTDTDDELDAAALLNDLIDNPEVTDTPTSTDNDPATTPESTDEDTSSDTPPSNEPAPQVKATKADLLAALRSSKAASTPSSSKKGKKGSSKAKKSALEILNGMEVPTLGFPMALPEYTPQEITLTILKDGSPSNPQTIKADDQVKAAIIVARELKEGTPSLDTADHFMTNGYKTIVVTPVGLTEEIYRRAFGRRRRLIWNDVRAVVIAGTGETPIKPWSNPTRFEHIGAMNHADAKGLLTTPNFVLPGEVEALEATLIAYSLRLLEALKAKTEKEYDEALGADLHKEALHAWKYLVTQRRVVREQAKAREADEAARAALAQ